jgi:putative lipoic acid-binding regulatory protein
VVEDDSAFEFPCDIPVKVFGRNDDAFQITVFEIARRHFPDFDAELVRSRLSRGDRFLSITLNLYVESKAQIDALYTEMSAHEHVLMML